jgi:DNA-binding SARP family transcriptional activator
VFPNSDSPIGSAPHNGQIGADPLKVSVLGTFEFFVGDEALPAEAGSSQRLLAFLALRDRAVMRATVAGTLWPEASEDHAHSSLRSAISRLSEWNRQAVLVNPLDLRLGESVTVDIREARSLAHRLLDIDALPPRADLSASSIDALSADLLPDWYDDWVVLEAEDWRQLRLHALEALAQRFTDGGQFGDAAGAALAAVRADPLRESPRSTLIRAHLAEGNQSEAIREFERYRAQLRTELGLEPTPQLQALIADLSRS